MQEFVEQFIEYMIARYKRATFGIETIRFELLTHYNKKSLMYGSIGGKWLRSFLQIVQQLGYGTYNEATLLFVLNSDNENVMMWLKKYVKE